MKLAGAILGSLTLGTLAIAQPSPSSPEAPSPDLEALLSPTVTTATQTGSSALTVPAVVEVITRQQIRDRGYRDLGDVLNDLPENQVDRRNFAFGDPTAQYTQEGFKADANGNMLVLFNGHRLNDFLAGSRYGVDEMILDTVERIEVVRGAGSSLYGANAFTSVVNIITDPEDPNERYVRVRGQGTPTARGGAGEASFKTWLGTEGVFQGSLYVERQRGQSLLIDNGTMGAGYGYDGIRPSFYGNALLSYKGLRVYVLGDRQVKDPFTQYNVVNPSNDPNLYFFHQSMAAGADYTLQVNDRLSFKIAPGWHDDSFAQFALVPIFETNAAGEVQTDANGKPILQPVTLNRQGLSVTTPFLTDGYTIRTRTLDIDLQGTWKYFRNNTLLFGVNASQDAITDSTRDSEIELSPFNYTDRHHYTDVANQSLFDPHASRLTLAAYAQVDYEILAGLEAIAGLRFDNYTGTGLLHQHYSELTPRVGVSYRESHVGALKLTFGTATRVPNLFEALLDNVTLSDPANRPERISTFQAAWDRNWGQFLTTQLSGFSSRITNHLTSDAHLTADEVAAGFVARQINLPGVIPKSVGAVAQATLRLPYAELSANLTRLVYTDNGFGAPLPDVPRTMVNFNLLVPLGSLRLNLGGNYRADFAREVGDTRASVPDYFVLNFTESYAITRWLDFRIGVKNLTNKVYLAPASSPDMLHDFPMRGVDVWGELRATYNF